VKKITQGNFYTSLSDTTNYIQLSTNGLSSIRRTNDAKYDRVLFGIIVDLG